MIYLTEYRTAATTQTELFEDIVFPQRVHWFPDTYARKDSGMFYAPHKLAEKVLDAKLMETLRENPCRTAFILAAGNSHFAGINPKDFGKTQLTYTYKFLPFTLTQVYAGRIASACGAYDHVSSEIGRAHV